MIIIIEMKFIYFIFKINQFKNFQQKKNYNINIIVY